MSHNSSRPFLKWLGNKYRLMNKIAPHLPQGKRLIEPFSGSAAVFLNSQFDDYLLSDQNKDLVYLYHALKDEGQRFINYAKRLFTEENNQEAVYYQLREEFNACRRPRRRAALFLYLNRHGYNGLCRYNLSGGFNVPFGRYSSPYFPEKELRAFSEKSALCEFIHQDFRKTLALAREGDVIYCDPPYVPLSASANFTAYTNTQFGETEQIILAEQATSLANQGISVLISNHDTDFTRKHYAAAKLISFDIQRTISCHGNKRQKVRELIAIFEG